MARVKYTPRIRENYLNAGRRHLRELIFYWRDEQKVQPYIEILYKLAMARNALTSFQVAEIIGLQSIIDRKREFRRMGFRKTKRDAPDRIFSCFMALGKLAGIGEAACLALYLRDEIPHGYKYLRKYIGATTTNRIGLYDYSVRHEYTNRRPDKRARCIENYLKQLSDAEPRIRQMAKLFDVKDLPQVKIPPTIMRMIPR